MTLAYYHASLLVAIASAEHQVSECCAPCSRGVLDSAQNASYAQRSLVGYCCCCAWEHDDVITFQVIDLFATCTHAIAWNYYHSDTIGLYQDTIKIPSMQLDTLRHDVVLHCMEKTVAHREQMLSSPFLEVALARCKEPPVMALLLEATSALLAVWPYSLTTADKPIFNGILTMALSNVQVAQELLADTSTDIYWPWVACFTRTTRLLRSIENGDAPEPWWYRKIDLLGPPRHLTINPSQPRNPLLNVYTAKDSGLPNEPTPHTIEAAFKDVTAAFEAIGADYFPVKGTLIGFLRYGSTVGELLDNKFDLVDNDLDFWVRTNYTEWSTFCQDFTQQMIQRGWKQCTLHIETASPYRIPRIVICEREDPYFLVDVAPFDLLHDHLVDTKVCDGSGIALFPNTWRRVRHEGQWCHYSHEGLWLPASLVYPLSWCKAFGSRIPCPRQSSAFLQFLGYGPCLALPVISSTRDCSHTWNQRLQREWSDNEIEHIKAFAGKLTLEGYQSFSGDDWRQCVNHTIVDSGWFESCVDAYR